MKVKFPFVVLLLETFCTLILPGCLGKKEDGPKEVVQRYIEYAKNGDCEKFIDLFDWEGVCIYNFETSWYELDDSKKAGMIEGFKEDFRGRFERFRQLFEKNLSFDVKIAEEVISGDYAEIRLRSLKCELEGRPQPKPIKLVKRKGEWKIYTVDEQALREMQKKRRLDQLAREKQQLQMQEGQRQKGAVQEKNRRGFKGQGEDKSQKE